MRQRHYGLFASFLLGVIVPFVASVYYLFAAAQDQYASVFGFTVRSEQLEGAQALLGGLASLSGTSSSDTDILYEFIQSRTLVEKVSARLDLPALYSWPQNDPVFALRPDASFEDLVAYWQRMVRVSRASGSGLLEVRVNTFSAKDAQLVAETIVEESSRMINELSAIARADSTRYALEDLDSAVTRLKTAREALTRFRSQTRIVDPKADIQGQMGLLNSLETQLAEAIIEFNLLLETSRENDPRLEQARRRIAVIETLIDKERQKFGMGTTPQVAGEKDYSTLVGEFERLTVDLEYAQKSYLTAQTVRDVAQANAQRQSRYLATYANPSLPQSPEYPRRFELTAVMGTILLLIWSIGVLIFFSLRDRR
jgi:capsular polysaccharide transport system permease protein